MSREAVYQTHMHTQSQKENHRERTAKSVEPEMIKALLFGNNRINRNDINRNIKEQCVFLPACGGECILL